MTSKTAQLPCPKSAGNDWRTRGFPEENSAQPGFLYMVNIRSAIWLRECKGRRKDPNPDAWNGLV
jgi:hypothetical protein